MKAMFLSLCLTYHLTEWLDIVPVVFIFNPCLLDGGHVRLRGSFFLSFSPGCYRAFCWRSFVILSDLYLQGLVAVNADRLLVREAIMAEWLLVLGTLKALY